MRSRNIGIAFSVKNGEKVPANNFKNCRLVLVREELGGQREVVTWVRIGFIVDPEPD
jgi:hypothetical protein